MSTPLLSVIIATKDREPYCIAAIKSILAFKDERIQIAIADNSTTTQIKDFVSDLNSPQISYTYDGGPVSSIDNFNRATELASGEFVIMIGDDDAILPNCIHTAVWMKENNIDAVSSNEYIIYFWPTTQANGKGLLKIPAFSKKIVKYYNRENLQLLLENGILNYHAYNLPKVYHGIIKKSKLDEVKAKAGHFFGGLSPDIYAAVSLALVIENGYIFDFPLSIAGVCKSSTSFYETRRAHCGPKDEMPHLNHRKSPYQWNNLIPKFNSEHSVWSNSAIDALKDMGELEILKKFNHFKYYNRLEQIYPTVIPEYYYPAMEEIREFLNLDEATFKHNITVAGNQKNGNIVAIYWDKVVRKIQSLSSTKKVVNADVKDIEMAIKEVSKVISMNYLPKI